MTKIRRKSIAIMVASYAKAVDYGHQLCKQPSRRRQSAVAGAGQERFRRLRYDNSKKSHGAKANDETRSRSA
jgi:hypothetical protein